MDVRRRTESDLDACVALAALVKTVDDYPPHLPHELLRFVAGSDSIDAWVAEEEGNIIGHVALNRTTSDEVMALAGQVLGTPPEALAVVARLFVAPSRRGEGTGAGLLRTATVAAVDRGLTPILDVATHFNPAIALYEKLGWRRVGSVTLTFLDHDLHEFVYVGPARSDRRLGPRALGRVGGVMAQIGEAGRDASPGTRRCSRHGPVQHSQRRHHGGMTLPPGHYGSAGKAADVPRPSPPLERLSWRWFVPRSRVGRITAGLVAGIMALLIAALGPSTAVLFAGLGAFSFSSRASPCGECIQSGACGGATL